MEFALLTGGRFWGNIVTGGGGSRGASSCLFLLSEPGKASPGKVERPVRAGSSHGGTWPAFRRAPGPVSTRSSRGLRRSFVLGWISEPRRCGRTDARTRAGAERSGERETRPVRGGASPATSTEPQAESSGSVSVLRREALVEEGVGRGGAAVRRRTEQPL